LAPARGTIEVVERALTASTSAEQRALTASMASHFGEVAVRRE